MLAGGAPRSAAPQEPGDEVVVVYNTRVPESRDVAEHYAAVRHVPAEQVLGLDLPEAEAMSRDRVPGPAAKAAH